MATERIKELFDKHGIAYPRLKSNGKYGINGSSLCDMRTEGESLEVFIQYLIRGNREGHNLLPKEIEKYLEESN